MKQDSIQYFRKKKIIRSLILLSFVMAQFNYALLQSVREAQADDSPSGTSIRIEPRGSGWDVYVKFHVSKVNIPQIKFIGSLNNVTATYPQPYVVGYNFVIDHDRCGGKYDPLTQTWQNPTSGIATIEIFFPSGTFSDPDLPDITETTVIRRSDCGEDGPTHLVPQPIIDNQDLPAITLSIWTRIDLPELEIQANPMTGLVTVPEWFWLQLKSNHQWWPGTDPLQGGQPFGVSVSIPLPGQTQTVVVLADVTKATWNFGDNGQKALKTSTLVGKAYPTKSNVQHPYNTADVFKPSILLHYVPRYAWNGGSWVQLESLFRESLWEGEVRIKEAQTVLVEPDRPSFPS